jgi:hypothetical protein
VRRLSRTVPFRQAVPFGKARFRGLGKDSNRRFRTYQMDAVTSSGDVTRADAPFRQMSNHTHASAVVRGVEDALLVLRQNRKGDSGALMQ